MPKSDYLIETKDVYQIFDDTGDFNIAVIESNGGVHYDITSHGLLSSESLAKCAELLKELIHVDCYNSVVRKGEAQGNLKVVKKVTARLEKLLEQRNSFVPKNKA